MRDLSPKGHNWPHMFLVTIRRLPICLEGMRWGSGETPWTFREWFWHRATLPLYLLPTPIRQGGYWGKKYRQSHCAKCFCISSYSNSYSCGLMAFTFLNCPFRGFSNWRQMKWQQCARPVMRNVMHIMTVMSWEVCEWLCLSVIFPLATVNAVIIILHTWGMSSAEIHISLFVWGFPSFSFSSLSRFWVRGRDGKPFSKEMSLWVDFPCWMPLLLI